MAARPIRTVNISGSMQSQHRAWWLAVPGRHVRMGRPCAPARGIAALAPKCELISDPAALEALAQLWSELASNAADANALFEPEAVQAAMRHLGADLRVLFVWQEAMLIAAFPIQSAKLGRLKLPGASLLWHTYSFLSAPLVHRDHAAAAMQAYTQFLAAGGAGAFMLHGLTLAQGTCATALKQALGLHGMDYRSFGTHERACLASNLSGEAYLQNALSKKRLKEYRRLAARLGEQGELAFDLIASPDDMAAAVQQFLALEAAGWKGARGTAMAMQAHSRQFVEAYCAAAAARGSFRVARLTLGGKPIAAALLLSSGRSAFLWKIAYDERYAASSPGVLLVLELTRKILDDRLFDLVDSCAIANHPMIDRIWRERLAIEDLLIVPSAMLAQGLFAGFTAWRNMRLRAKHAMQWLRSRKPA